LPVFLEKRPGGKSVTVIRNLSGDLDGLLRLLKRQIGAGGVVREGAIEIQGDHRARVEAFLERCR
jgi:translation initiation factor 1